MKRLLLAFALILLLTLSFTACTEEEENSGDNIEDEIVEDLPDHTHTPGDWVTTWSASCNENGYRQIECTECFEILERQIIEATGHNMKNDVCTVCGASYSKGLEFESLGDGECFVKSIGGCEDKDIIIPPTSPEGEKVVYIDAYAFFDCVDILSVDIPDSVTKIGTAAFMNCEGLESLFIRGGVETVGESAFQNCNSLSSASIGGGVKTVEDYAFHECKTLTYLTIGKSVEKIGYAAFNGCLALENIELPESLMEIGEYSFSGCENLKKVIFGEKSNLEIISYNAFSDCPSFASITIPDSVTTICESAFQKCIGLSSVTVGEGVKTIEDYAFYECTSLASITLGKSVESIGYASFNGCLALEKVDLPESLREIGKYSFSNCAKLKSISFDKNTLLEVIPYNSFSECRSLASITIPDSVTTIESSAFQNCASLSSVVIGNGVKVIDDYAFHECSSLASLTLGKSVESIGYASFYGCLALEKLELPASLTEIGMYAFADCENMTKLTFAEGIKLYEIESSAFRSCKKLNRLEIPDSVGIIGESAFQDCISLAYLHIGSGTTEIEQYAFYCCRDLTDLTIGESVENIGSAAFGGTESLRKAVLPNALSKMGTYAFANSGIETVICGDKLERLSTSVFKNCKNLTTVVVGDGLREIASDAFADCDILKRLFYTGTKDTWKTINCFNSTDPVVISPFYYSELEPKANGDYWYYNEDGEIRIWNLTSDAFFAEIYAFDFADKCLLEKSLGSQLLADIKLTMAADVIGWEMVHIAAEPNHITDKENGLILKKDLYKYVIYDILTGEHSDETMLKALDSASYSILTDIAKAIMDNGVEINADNVNAALKAFDLGKFGKEISPLFSKDFLDKIDIFIKLADNSLEAAQAIARYYAMQNVAESYINVIRQIAQDESNNLDMRMAAEDIVQCYENALYLTLEEFQSAVFFDASVEDTFDAFGEKCWELLIQCDKTGWLKGIHYGGKVIKALAEDLEIDVLVDSYYKLKVSVALENAVNKIVFEVNDAYKKTDFLKVQNIHLCSDYIGAIELLERLLLLENSYSLKFYEAYKTVYPIFVKEDEYEKLVAVINENTKIKKDLFYSFDESVSKRFDRYCE